MAILGVLGAGAAYLPVDITLPGARIESMLRQANPVLAITDTGSAELVAASVPTLVIDDPVVAERISRRNAIAPAVRRHPGHSAYVIFTSGSTGEPKGVIGTHAALLSYHADHRDRIYPLAWQRLGRPMRIAHAWSLSFDASWQPMVGLLDGHGIHLFDAQEMRDADRLVQGIVDHQIDMIDTTPSMLGQLRAAGLSDHHLEVLALGGEAINAVLWQQLRSLPAGAVYNCYGPTEATVEAVVAAVREYPTPTIGTANAGTRGYVLDSALRIVPHGVVGELYLSGAQLARGYVGRPAMTAARFVADPFRPGQRMYRTGDLVRRLPHGGYAYLGRGDTQVKVRGYRVEIGEIEGALRSQSHVHDAAVSVVRRAGGATLVGFVVWQDNTEGDPTTLRAALTELLPAYMVPARIVALPRLPVNANGKLDGHALDELARDELARGARGPVEPSTDNERVLCELLAELFNGVTPHLDDDFITLGLDSILAIGLVHKARRRGLALSPRMVFTAPTVRGLAAAIDTAGECDPSVTDAEYGEVLPLPIVSWVNEYGNYRRFTNTVLLRLPAGVERSAIEQLLQLVLDGHESLRSILTDTPDGARLVTRQPGVVLAAEVLSRVELSTSTDTELAALVRSSARRAIDEIDPRAGAMMRAVWFDGTADRQMLLLTIHHLVVDVVSWHILLSDISEGWRSVRAGAAPKSLPEFTSYRRWSELMWDRAGAPEVIAQREYWSALLRDPDPALGVRHPDPARDTWSTLRVTNSVTPVEVSERLLTTLNRDDRMREILLCAVTIVLASWRRTREQDPYSGALIALDGHGRADALLDTDTTNTVGWFTVAFPVRLGVGAAAVDIEQLEAAPELARTLLDSVTAYLGTVPYDGLDYGLLRYVDRVPELQEAVEPQVLFNYLGRLDLGVVSDEPWTLIDGHEIDALPVDPEPDLPLRFALNMSLLVRGTATGQQLVNTLLWSEALFTPTDIDRLTQLWQRTLAALAAGLDAKA